MKYISVAIDGPSGAGKSTLARQAAKQLGYLYVDTGAIYRTVALSAVRAGIDPADAPRLIPTLEKLDIRLDYGSDGLQHMYLNGEDVSHAIREHAISQHASTVSAIPQVRAFLLDLQRELARNNNVIMDGRDIGTVVLPEAQVKLFLTAAPEARARRRHLELCQRGQDTPFETVLQDIIRRDEQDTNRAIAPLRQAEDAVLVDTTHLDLEQSLHAIVSAIEEKIK
ncbi:MAG: (d)CMP kinase [Oscillospiraceae bacterium]|nr:(d)CMP kinase [Oscillospiraceae bacterium]